MPSLRHLSVTFYKAVKNPLPSHEEQENKLIALLQKQGFASWTLGDWRKKLAGAANPDVSLEEALRASISPPESLMVGTSHLFKVGSTSALLLYVTRFHRNRVIFAGPGQGNIPDARTCRVVSDAPAASSCHRLDSAERIAHCSHPGVP